MHMNCVRQIRIDFVHIECKQQETKVDTDAGLIDTWTIQLYVSSMCLRRLLLVYSRLIQVTTRQYSIEFHRSSLSLVILECEHSRRKISSQTSRYYTNT
jgi:hypothetical protein